MYKTAGGYYVVKDLIHGQFGDRLLPTIRTTGRLDTSNTPILIETGTTGGASEFLYKEYKKQ